MSEMICDGEYLCKFYILHTEIQRAENIEGHPNRYIALEVYISREPLIHQSGNGLVHVPIEIVD